MSWHIPDKSRGLKNVDQLSTPLNVYAPYLINPQDPTKVFWNKQKRNNRNCVKCNILDALVWFKTRCSVTNSNWLIFNRRMHYFGNKKHHYTKKFTHLIIVKWLTRNFFHIFHIIRDPVSYTLGILPLSVVTLTLQVGFLVAFPPNSYACLTYSFSLLHFNSLIFML